MLKIAASLPKIISSLDNSQSIAPMFTKDLIDNTGRTTMAYKTGGKHEARERFIEEFSTGALWIFGIPVFRKIFDAAVFKPLKIDPKTDLRLLPQFQKWTKGKTSQALNITKKVQHKILALNAAKVVFSTAVPLYLLATALPKFNQGLTKKKVEEENATSTNVKFEGLKLNSSKSNLFKPAIFKTFTKNSDSLSFTGMGARFGKELRKWFDPVTASQSAQINPVDNMLFLDAGISGSRTINARNKHERAEVVFRESGIIFFFFFAAHIIKNGLAKLSNKFFNTPVELDAKVIGNKEFTKKVIETSKNDGIEFLKFTNETKETKVIKFIKNELKNNTTVKDGSVKFKNTTLETAKQLGLLDVINKDNKFILNPNKFIETNKIIQINKDMKTLLESVKVKAKGNTKTAEKVMKNVFRTKTGLVLGNIAICSFSLAYVLPKLQYKLRQVLTGKNDFPGIEGLKDK